MRQSGRGIADLSGPSTKEYLITRRISTSERSRKIYDGNLRYCRTARTIFGLSSPKALDIYVDEFTKLKVKRARQVESLQVNNLP